MTETVTSTNELPQFSGRALIVEENKEILRLSIQTLLSFGLKADGVESGEDAIQACLSKNYQIVFLADNLSDLSAEETLNLLLACGHDMPIIAVIEDKSLNKIKDVMGSGFCAAITKPLKQHELLSILQAHYHNLTDNKVQAVPEHTFKQLKQSLIQNYPDYIAELKNALNGQQMITLNKLAHKIKGAAKLFELHDEALLAERLEQQTKNADLNYQITAMKLINQLEKTKK